MREIKNAFTLSETMIVIVVLGIIATLTIPALVNKNKESVAKTKLRKAMAAYESALNKMIIENDLKDNGPLNDWASAVDNCGNPNQYFKKVQGDGCIFKTSDGIWWDISDIERPLIAFKENDLTTEKANAQNDYSAFVLVGRFGTDGSLRVDDLAYETANDTNNSKAQVEKLYNLLSGKKSSAEEVASCDKNDMICKFISGYDIPTCTNENKLCKLNGHVYDENGRQIIYYETTTNSQGKEYPNYAEFDFPDGSFMYWDANENERMEFYTLADGSYNERFYKPDNNGEFYKYYDTISYADGSRMYESWELDGNGKVYKTEHYEERADGSATEMYWALDNNNKVYKRAEGIFYADGSSSELSWSIDSKNNIYKTSETTRNADSSVTGYGWSVDLNDNVYKSSEYIRNTDGTYITTKWSLNSNGNTYKSMESSVGIYVPGMSCTMYFDENNNVTSKTRYCP